MIILTQEMAMMLRDRIQARLDREFDGREMDVDIYNEMQRVITDEEQKFVLEFCCSAGTIH